MKPKTLHLFKNGQDDENKISSRFTVEANAISDRGDGNITFTKPVTITDNSEQWNGTKYDLKSFDMTGWNQLLTADHNSSIKSVLGKVKGLKNVANHRITIDGIDFAIKQNPLADFAYNMMLAGYLTDFSIETIGPWPDEEGVYHDSKLVGLSVVVAGNNKQAHINQIAHESISRAKQNGVDASPLEELVKLPVDKENEISNNTDMFITVKNTRGFAITLKYKNSAGEDVETKVEPGKSVDVPSAEAPAVEAQVAAATEPKPPTEEKKDEKKNESLDVEKAVKNAVEPLTAKIAELEQKVFDNGAKEPTFRKVNDSKVTSELNAMDWRDRHAKQINLAWDMLKSGNQDAGKQLNEINKFHVEKLQEKGIIRNSMTISDFGNFVISPELLSEIEGFRSNFQALLGKLNFRDTLSLQMAWLNRNGDIDMSEVDMCTDGDAGNLKPISTYTAEIKTSNLHELAAVTPVCNAATRFLAADLLGDVAAGYRNDFDRKKAQLFIARLQQAINLTGKTHSYATTSDVNALKSWFDVAADMQQDVMNGLYVLSQKSYWELMKRQAGAGVNTDLGFKIFTTGDNGPLMLGAPYVIVPNELMPTLNSAETRSFTVEGVTVTINQGVFYVDPSTFSGRTSGGLMYDLSTEAAYEESGTVKSAFQRNELVLRGSFFRGGAIRNVDKVVGLGSPGFS